MKADVLTAKTRRPLTAAEVIAPGCGSTRLLTRSPARMAASKADLRPPAARLGQDDALALPSRMGNRLHYRDGRVTDMLGNLLVDEA